MQRKKNNKYLWDVRDRILEDPFINKIAEESDLAYKMQRILIESRIKHRLSQAEVARMLGTTQSVISRFEAGGSNPTIDFLQRLFDVLGVKITLTASYPDHIH